MKFQAILALAALVTAIPFEGDRLYKRDDNGRIHIGFRTINKAEAKEISDAGGKMVKSKGGAGRQLGKGIYLTPNFKGWPEAEANRGPDDPPLWDCVATVDPAYWDAANKAWIWQYYSFPEDQDNDPDACVALKMWGMFPVQIRARDRFLQSLNPTWTVANTLRFSYAGGYIGTVQQVLVPDEIIDAGVFYFNCAERGSTQNDDIGNIYGTVDWHIDDMAGHNLRGGSDTK